VFDCLAVNKEKMKSGDLTSREWYAYDKRSLFLKGTFICYACCIQGTRTHQTMVPLVVFALGRTVSEILNGEHFSEQCRIP
jgi:hypothetical protein